MQVQTRSSFCAMPAAVYIEACASMGRVLYGLCGVRIAQEKPQCARGSGNYLIQRCDAGQTGTNLLSLSRYIPKPFLKRQTQAGKQGLLP